MDFGTSCYKSFPETNFFRGKKAHQSFRGAERPQRKSANREKGADNKKGGGVNARASGAKSRRVETHCLP